MTDLPVIISRAEAKALGLSRYFTGLPCSKGHIALRNTASGGCFSCRLVPKEKRVKAKLIRLEDGTYKADKPCKRCGSETRNKFGMCRICVNERNKSRSRDYWNNVVKGSEKQKIYSKRAYHNNKASSHENAAARRTLKRIHSLRSKDARNEMRLIYKNKPEGFHVDHLVPLRGSKKVCGLHCPANMQYLTAKENLEKGGKWPTCQKSMRPACFDIDDNAL